MKLFNILLQWYGKAILKILGWKTMGTVPSDPKYVMIVAPHTSIADMFMGKIYSWAVGFRSKIMIKKEFFVFPVNLFIKLLGGIPIDRKHAKNTVDQMVDVFAERKKLILSITPEGTRARNRKWKTGFYRIAVKSNIPIYLTTIDYQNKTLGFLCKFVPTGDFDTDIKIIQQKYKGIKGYHPNKFTINE